MHIVKSVVAVCLVMVTVTVEVDGDTWACPPCPPGAINASSCRTIRPDPEITRSSTLCRYLVKDIVKLTIVFLVYSDHYKINSEDEDLKLDDASIPQLPARRNVSSVTLRGFPPPQGTYADALLALNVTVRDSLELQNIPLTAEPLRADHFQGLETLQLVVITSSRTVLPANIFTPLTALTKLILHFVLFKEDFLMTLPTSLKNLELAKCSVSTFPAAVMSRLRALTQLTLMDQPLESPPALETAPSLAEVSIIKSPLKHMPRLLKLRNATIRSSELEVIRLPGGCGSLQFLTVQFAPVTSLPAAWLTATDGIGECCQLRKLELLSLEHLVSVHERALNGACYLTELELSGCRRLETLPVGLMQPLTNLQMLVLKENNLKTLPGGILDPLTSLQWLDVSSNALTVRALEGTLTGTLPALTTLEAGENWLFDLCSPVYATPNETLSTLVSPLYLIRSLQRLSLPNAGITRVCPQWRRQLVNLRELNLRANKITEITLEDMQWERAANVAVIVNVENNPISRVTLSESQYTYLSGSRAAHNVTVTMMADYVLVRCDCKAYWLARAKKESLLPIKINSIWCQDRTALERIDLHTMVCKRSECSAGCSCYWWPPGDTMMVSCATVSSGDRYNDSTTWPSLQAVSAKQIELVLSNTNMSRVPLTPLPERVRRLDVSNNALSDVTKLLALDGVKLRLQHNALLCDCSQLRELHRRRHQIEDFEHVTCGDGSLLTSHDPSQLCGYEVVAAVGLAVGLLLLVVGGVVGARRVIAARAEEHHRKILAEAPYKYDGFLVFSHKDWWFAQRVMSAMESDRGLRLCVHDRDWAPGEWVPAAIERSVERSRRTLAIVSVHMARSQWACVELQQAAARAQAGRGLGPVLVLLGPVPREMRRHVRRHQSLRSTDRRLWDKLHRLLAAAPNNVTAHPPIRHVRGVIHAEETGANRFSE